LRAIVSLFDSFFLSWEPTLNPPHDPVEVLCRLFLSGPLYHKQKRSFAIPFLVSFPSLLFPPTGHLSCTHLNHLLLDPTPNPLLASPPPLNTRRLPSFVPQETCLFTLKFSVPVSTKRLISFAFFNFRSSSPFNPFPLHSGGPSFYRFQNQHSVPSLGLIKPPPRFLGGGFFVGPPKTPLDQTSPHKTHSHICNFSPP